MPEVSKKWGVFYLSLISFGSPFLSPISDRYSPSTTATSTSGGAKSSSNNSGRSINSGNNLFYSRNETLKLKPDHMSMMMQSFGGSNDNEDYSNVADLTANNHESSSSEGNYSRPYVVTNQSGANPMEYYCQTGQVEHQQQPKPPAKTSTNSFLASLWRRRQQSNAGGNHQPPSNSSSSRLLFQSGTSSATSSPRIQYSGLQVTLNARRDGSSRIVQHSRRMGGGGGGGVGHNDNMSFNTIGYNRRGNNNDGVGRSNGNCRRQQMLTLRPTTSGNNVESARGIMPNPDDILPREAWTDFSGRMDDNWTQELNCNGGSRNNNSNGTGSDYDNKSVGDEEDEEGKEGGESRRLPSSCHKRRKDAGGGGGRQQQQRRDSDEGDNWVRKKRGDQKGGEEVTTAEAADASNNEIEPLLLQRNHHHQHQRRVAAMSPPSATITNSPPQAFGGGGGGVVAAAATEQINRFQFQNKPGRDSFCDPVSTASTASMRLSLNSNCTVVSTDLSPLTPANANNADVKHDSSNESDFGGDEYDDLRRPSRPPRPRKRKSKSVTNSTSSSSNASYPQR